MAVSSDSAFQCSSVRIFTRFALNENVVHTDMYGRCAAGNSRFVRYRDSDLGMNAEYAFGRVLLAIQINDTVAAIYLQPYSVVACDQHPSWTLQNEGGARLVNLSLVRARVICLQAAEGPRYFVTPDSGDAMWPRDRLNPAPPQPAVEESSSDSDSSGGADDDSIADGWFNAAQDDPVHREQMS
jgi:hypothetical protein